MKTILLRDLQFYDNKAMNHHKSLYIASHQALDLLPETVREWCQQNGVHPAVESYNDVSAWCLRVRVYAQVPDSLATYYLLRWGTPDMESVHT